MTADALRRVVSPQKNKNASQLGSEKIPSPSASTLKIRNSRVVRDRETRFEGAGCWGRGASGERRKTGARHETRNCYKQSQIVEKKKSAKIHMFKTSISTPGTTYQKMATTFFRVARDSEKFSMFESENATLKVRFKTSLRTSGTTYQKMARTLFAPRGTLKFFRPRGEKFQSPKKEHTRTTWKSHRNVRPRAEAPDARRNPQIAGENERVP